MIEWELWGERTVWALSNELKMHVHKRWIHIYHWLLRESNEQRGGKMVVHRAENFGEWKKQSRMKKKMRNKRKNQIYMASVMKNGKRRMVIKRLLWRNEETNLIFKWKVHVCRQIISARFRFCILCMHWSSMQTSHSWRAKQALFENGMATPLQFLCVSVSLQMCFFLSRLDAGTPRLWFSGSKQRSKCPSINL